MSHPTPASPPSGADRPRLLMVLLLVALGWILCLRAGFFWDDRALVLSEPKPWTALLWGDLWGGTSPYYRPITALSIRLDQALFGDGPVGFHLVNLGWHLLATALVWRLVQGRVSPDRALLAALIFGIHPIQGEAVIWTVARNDPMATVGVLGVLIAADRARQGAAGALLLVGIAAVFGSFSKETAIFAPVYLAAWRWIWRERPGAAELVVASVGPLLALLVRIALDVQDPTTGTHQFARGYLAEAVVHVLAWLTVPWPLTSLVSALAPPDPVEVFGCLLTLGLLFWLRRGWRWGVPAVVALAPALWSGLSTGLLGERFLYLPLVFVVCGVVATLPALDGVRLRVARMVGLILLGASLLLNQLRLGEWESETTLLEAALHRSPSSYVYFTLGQLHRREGDVRSAYRWWLAAVRAPRPMLNACGLPERVLVEANAIPEALAVATESAKGPCAAIERFQRTHYLIRVLSDLPPGEEPDGADARARVVVRLGEGDLLAPMETVVLGGWRGDAARFREQLFWFEHGRWPPTGSPAGANHVSPGAAKLEAP